MKVLHVIPSVSERSGGPGQAIVPMCRTLQARGIELLIATTDADLETRNLSYKTQNGNHAQPTRNPTIQDHKGIPTIFFPAQWGQSFKYSRPLAAWLEERVRDFDLVHIHAVFNHCCIAAAKVCRDKKVPYIVRPLGTLNPWSMKQKSLRKQLFWRFAGKEMFKHAAAVHYTTNAEQKATEESLGLNHGVVVPLGVDTRLFTSEQDDEVFQRRFPSLTGFPYLLVLSRLHPKKGLDILIDAFVPLVRQPKFSQWRLVLAGDGSPGYVDSLRKKVTAHGGDEVVMFPGWLQGRMKLSALQHSSLLVLPSHQENFGLCVVEALACGVPVLVSQHVNLASEIEAARAGWITHLERNGLRGSLIEALSSKVERKLRGEAGKQLALKFDWPRIGEQLTTVYSDVLRS
jgi:glycosyltransferase involved in cell wall biosynthesis